MLYQWLLLTACACVSCACSPRPSRLHLLPPSLAMASPLRVSWCVTPHSPRHRQLHQRTHTYTHTSSTWTTACLLRLRQAYSIRAKDSTGRSWVVSHRYNSFKALHTALKTHFKGSALPPFPPSKWFGETEESFVKQRQALLQRYLQGVLADPTMGRSEIVLGWLAKSCKGAKAVHND